MSERIRTVRTPHTSKRPYFSMARKTAQDNRLSWEARGVLSYLLSKPDDWKVLIVDLKQNCGRDKVRKILNELKTFGYLEITQLHDAKGKFQENEYTVHEEPFTEKPLTDNPATDKPFTKNHPLHNTDSTEYRKEIPSLPKAKGGRKQDPEYNVISELWHTTASGIIVNLKGMLFGTRKVRGQWKTCELTPYTSVDELRAFALYAKKRMPPGAKEVIPTAPVTVQKWFCDFRAERVKKSNIMTIEFEAPVSPMDRHEQFIAPLEGEKLA